MLSTCLFVGIYFVFEFSVIELQKLRCRLLLGIVPFNFHADCGHARQNAGLDNADAHPYGVKLRENEVGNGLRQAFQQQEIAFGQFAAEGLADFAVVDGLGDVVLRACVVGQGDVKVDDEGLRLLAFPFVHADKGFGFHAVQKDFVHG